MRMTGMAKLWGYRYGINRAWLGGPYVFLSDPETVEVFLYLYIFINKLISCFTMSLTLLTILNIDVYTKDILTTLIILKY